jgi:hypothetical protein
LRNAPPIRKFKDWPKLLVFQPMNY